MTQLSDMPAVAITAPEMTIDQYAQTIGVSRHVVDGWIKRGYLPSLKIGKYRMVNVMQRAIDCAEQSA